jgi:hypothetical protein
MLVFLLLLCAECFEAIAFTLRLQDRMPTPLQIMMQWRAVAEHWGMRAQQFFLEKGGSVEMALAHVIDVCAHDEGDGDPFLLAYGQSSDSEHEQQQQQQQQQQQGGIVVVEGRMTQTAAAAAAAGGGGGAAAAAAGAGPIRGAVGLNGGLGLGLGLGLGFGTQQQRVRLPRCGNDSNFEGVFAVLVGAVVPRRMRGCPLCAFASRDDD